MSCVVWGCGNDSLSTADPSVHYYVFPKQPVIAQQWIAAAGWRPEDIDLNTARICSIHFSDDSYTTEVKVIEYMTCYTKVLKFDAIPTLFLPLTTQIVINDTNSQEISSDIDNKKEYTELTVLNQYTNVQTKEQLLSLENCNKNLRIKVDKLDENVTSLKINLQQLIDSYKSKDLELYKLNQEYAKSKQVLPLQTQKKLLSKVFSESQIKILSGKKKIYWSDDDMAVGYTIRHLSNKRCYLYLTKKLNIPLPAVSSIKRWMTLKKSQKKEENSD